jgi:GTA TIM-barrel-like domain
MSYPTITPRNDLSYTIGNFTQYVPPFTPDTVMIRPYGEYGMWTGGIYTKRNGGYWINANSYASDPASAPMADLVYLVQNDLKVLSGVKKVVIQLHWYQSIDSSNAAYNKLVPAIGPEVQAWNWSSPPNAEYIVYPWTRANAYYLKDNHQVWPTPDDNALIEGIQYLQASGYQVGICPVASLISNNFYWPNGGEWEIDRSYWNWTNQTALTNWLAQYTTFYHHYIDLMKSNSITPWIMYLGYGMRDLTCISNTTFLNQAIMTIQNLIKYSKAQLPNTLTTYAADLDEYYYSYLKIQNNGYLDPLWTTNGLDFVGVNWFAPLAIDDSEDSNLLQQNVTQGEAELYYLPSLGWRGSEADRQITNTTRNFKTGIAQAPITPSFQGVKDITDWLAFYHYTPAISGVLAGCSPLPEIPPGDARLCSHMHGTGPVGSVLVKTPTVGGIAPVPALKDTWLAVQLHSYTGFTLPSTIPDNTTMAFEIDFEIDPTLTDLTGSYRLFDSSFGLKLDSIDGTITVWFKTQDGSYQSVPLFSAPSGSVSLVYTAASVSISVDGAFDLTVTPNVGALFQVPTVLDTMWLGNPANASQGVLPSGYGVWQGQIYFLSLVMGVSQLSGGQFYFDDSYCGIRTAWNPGMKPWMATSFGYGSVHGSAADPQTRPTTILYSGGSALPVWYADYANASAAVFRNNFKVWNIQGPYGSTYDPDQIYQAIVVAAACLGIIEAGAQHQVAWFFDTRSGGAYTFKATDGTQIYNDAYDFELNCVLNSKAAVRDNGTHSVDNPLITVDNDLGLSIVPGPQPKIRAILVQAGTPQQ